MSETKIERFVRRLNDDSRHQPSGPFTAQPWCDLHNIYSGRRIVGNIKQDNLMISPDVGPGAAEWLRETWRGLDAPPAIPPRVQRFLDALMAHGIAFRDENDRKIEGPYVVVPVPDHEALSILASDGIEWAQIHKQLLCLDSTIRVPLASLIQHLWAETARTPKEEDLLKRISNLEAECAEKTRRLDQIKAILEGGK